MTSRRERNAQRIAACDEQAERLGLRAGMGIADVRARHPDIVVEHEDASADRRLLETLARAATVETRPERRDALRRHADLALAAGCAGTSDAAALAALEARRNAFPDPA